MKVVILAGGKGTRLQSVVSDVPKPMASIHGKPFLEYLMEYLRKQGATEFILCVSHLKEIIIDYFGTSWNNIPIRYSIEEVPLGTGGALKQAFEMFNLDEAIAVNGDTFAEADYARLWQEGQNELLAILLKAVPDTGRYGRVEVKDGRVACFQEKQEATYGFINAGVYRIKKEIFVNMPDAFSFEKDLLEVLVEQIHPKVFIAGAYFIDIGLPETYAQAQTDLENIVYGKRNKALFLDRDGVINVDKGHVYKIEDCEFIDCIFDICRNAKSLGYLLIVVTNQAGIAKGFFTEKDFNKLMVYIKNEFIRQNCPLDDVFYCPYHKDGIGKYRRNSYDRKPQPGMILTAAKKYNIDLSKSILIGDKLSDIDAGKNAGIIMNYLYIN